MLLIFRYNMIASIGNVISKVYMITRLKVNL